MHGRQWSIFPEIKTAEDVQQIVEHAMAEERREAEEREAEEQQFKAECQRLKTAPEYSALSQGKKGAVQVTGNIRKELKAKFPGIKFSVRKRSYDSISVNWIDGPTEEQVREITDKYRDSYFDGMQDMSVSCSSPFNEIYGGVGYVFIDRDYSDAMKQQAIETLRIKYDQLSDGENISVVRYNTGELWRIRQDYFGHGHDIQGEINKILAVTTA